MTRMGKTLWLGFLTGLLVVGGGMFFWPVLSDWISELRSCWGWEEISFEDQYVVTAQQLGRIGEGIASYQKANDGKRPERLGAVAAGEFAPVEAFYDERRDNTPALKDGDFAEPPDVLYMPALRPGDPGDLLLAFSLVLRKAGGKYPVLYNDGTTAALGRQDMLRALNRTYAYLGKVLGPQPPTQAAENK